MGIVNEVVEVKISPSNYKYYNNKGYNLPLKENGLIDFGQYIYVNVNDLTPYCTMKVEVECDNCYKKYYKKYSLYTRDNHNGKIYCNKCAHSLFASGKNHYLWKSDLSQEERELKRNYSEYTEFVKSVLARDNYTCQCCGVHNSSMEVHHLNGYDWYKEGRIDETNAITLCNHCHSHFHSIYGRGGNTREQFEEWTGNTTSLLEKYNGALPTARQVYDYTEKKIYKSANEWARIHKYDASTVYNCCNKKVRQQVIKLKNGETSYSTLQTKTLKGHYVLWYDEYIQMTENELNEYFHNCQSKVKLSVICLNNSEIFESVISACKKYNLCPISITRCCKGELSSTKSRKNRISYSWMYLSDFEKLSKEEQEKLLNIKDGEVQWQNT